MATPVRRNTKTSGTAGKIYLALAAICVAGVAGAYLLKRPAVQPATPPALPAPAIASTPRRALPTLPALPAEFSDKDPLDQVLAENSPAPAVIEKHVQTPAPDRPDFTLANVLEKHGAEREAALLELQKALQTANNPDLAIRAGRLFAESHPSSAMAWSAEIAATKEGPFVAQGVAEGLSNLRGGFSWADALPDQNARAKAIAALVIRLAANSPSEASVWLRRIPRGPDFDRAITAVVSEWAVRNPDAASVWLDKNQQFLEGKVFATFAGSWAKVSPAAANKWAKGLKDPAARQLAVAAIAQAQGN